MQVDCASMKVQGAKWGKAKCPTCGAKFARRKPWQRFCLPECRDKWHNPRKAKKLREARAAADR